MSAPVFDPVQLLAVLDRHGVRFVVIGGFAAVAYGSPLPTSDITPARDAENLGRLSEALSDLAARVRVRGIPGGWRSFTTATVWVASACSTSSHVSVNWSW